MKSACVFAALASAGAAAPPRISLKLEGMTGAYMLKHPIYREHDLGYTSANSLSVNKRVASRQDWTEKCPADQFCPPDAADNCENGGWVSTSVQNCPMPEAVAYDFNDGDHIVVTTRIFLIDVDGTAVDQASCATFGGEWQTNTGGSSCKASGITYDKKSTWLSKYDAKDAEGNYAEQVVFALMLDDTEAPFFKANCADTGYTFEKAIKVEAGSAWKLCESQAYDNVDGNVDSNIRYNIDFVAGGDGVNNVDNNAAFEHTSTWDHPQESITGGWVQYSAALAFLQATNTENSNTTAHIGDYMVTAKVHDSANIYGHDALDNVRTRKQSIKVVDTTAPWIELGGFKTTYVECTSEAAPSTGANVAPTSDGTQGEFYKEITRGQCLDAVDTEALGYWLPVTTTYTSHKEGPHVERNEQDIDFVDVNHKNDSTDQDTYHVEFANLFRQFGADTESKPVTTRKLKYTCEDVSGNPAQVRTRTVKTVDSLAPTIFLTEKGTGTDVVVQIAEHTDADRKHASAHRLDSFATMTVSQDQCNKANIETQLSWSAGNYATDRCSTNLVGTTVSWGNRALDCSQIGLYVRTFTVTDDAATGNVATALYHVHVEDTSKPILEVVLGDETIQASRTRNYTDAGAECSDNHVSNSSTSWDLNHAVEVSGDVVNLRVPGAYTIRYDCMDLSGNEAEPKYRHVTVVDTTRPILSLIGNNVNYIEAGFPYHDAGCTATDTLDGDLTRYVYTDGDTVDVSQTFDNDVSCQAIYDHSIEGNASQSQIDNGKYFLNPATANEPVYCYFHQEKSTEGKHHVTGYTYFHHKVADSHRDCSQVMKGMKKWSAVSSEIQNILQTYLDDTRQTAIGNLDDYICVYDNSDNEEAGIPKQENLFHDTDQTPSTSRTGIYQIGYFVKDKAGLAQQEVVYRTVIVKDTLPPVITLKLNNKLVHNGGVNHAHRHGDTVHKGDIKDVGINHYRVGGLSEEEYPHTRDSWGQDEQYNTPGGNYENGDATTANNAAHNFMNQKKYNQYNPAAYKNTSTYAITEGSERSFGNPNLSLMAESVSSHGWLVAAVASAVAGVALVGYSSRKSASISVPV
jgi:hypothetical protein